MKSKYLIIWILIFLAFSVLNAQDSKAGQYGYQFLKFPISPAQAGMANTGDVISKSPLTIFHHPAAFSWQRGAMVAASQTSWLIDTNIYNIAWRNVTLQNSVGFGINYVDHGKISRITNNGIEIGFYAPINLRATGNYSVRINPNINIGISANVLYEKIDTSSSLGLSSDIGFVFYTPIRYTSFDFAVKNLGISSKMDLEKTELPTVADFSLSTGFDLSDSVSFFPSVKVSYMQDHDNLLPAFGLQADIYELFFLRIGYKLNYNEENLSAGFGVKYKNINIDYSFVNNEIEPVNMIGIGWSFN